MRRIAPRSSPPESPPKFPIGRVLGAISRESARWPTPVVTVYSNRRASPFMILVSTILSLRTQDRTTAAASERLFALASTPEDLARLRLTRIERAIYPVGFYKTKARTLVDLCRALLRDHGGRVPDDLETLLTLKGVGRKTANLTLTLGFGRPGICVDTHVHRITNRWGYVRTNTPDETEMRLREILPRRYWISINDWLVAFGQNVCKPVSPMCSACPVAGHCPRVGVGRSR